MLLRLLALIACLPALAAAECVHWKPDARRPAELDGPGSFGALHNTVTLDCLRYAGSLTAEGKEWVLIKDDRDVVHRLKVGDFMGENSGVISAIDADFIYIRQVKQKARSGDYEETTVRFPRK